MKFFQVILLLLFFLESRQFFSYRKSFSLALLKYNVTLSLSISQFPQLGKRKPAKTSKTFLIAAES